MILLMLMLLLLLSTFAIAIAALATGCHFLPTFFPFLSPCKGSVAGDAGFEGEVFFLDSSWHVTNIVSSTISRSMNAASTNIRIIYDAGDGDGAADAAAVDK